MEKTLITFIFFLLLLSQRVHAQANPPGIEPDSHNSENFSRPKEIIIVAVIAIIIFIGFYFIYLCCCIDDQLMDFGNWSRWRPWNFTGSSQHSLKTPYGGLDPAVVKSFPTFKYESIKSTLIGKGTLECAVCLMEFNDKDILRLIPKCDHFFHTDCVDEWLVSHATCPVCRFNLTNADLWDYTSPNDDTEDDNDEMSRKRRVMKNLSRSLSTGHMDRFMLRLPREVGKRIKMFDGNTNLWIISGESSTKAGYREGFGEGSSTNRCKSERFGNDKVFSFGKQFTSKEDSFLGVVPVEPAQLLV
ncbi:hypothetical protein SOVF_102710 [Spinacia oleracea]|uniref:RING-type E3 ubiquitin transferase n=1 Tax=Spinacia oleracea TaxID=3562 RepID=A0A9R0JMV3_SPIOL|nr:E3 ubiquitin-protein ligase ATL6-like [Spinacia oleracea]KNA14948.1 hypothetical protein SOVF_102710 [Spinacia oleracea]